MKFCGSYTLLDNFSHKLTDSSPWVDDFSYKSFQTLTKLKRLKLRGRFQSSESIEMLPLSLVHLELDASNLDIQYLKPLQRFTNLQILNIYGQTSGLEHLTNLKLEWLSVEPSDGQLCYLKNLKLRYLKLTNVKQRAMDFEGFKMCETLESLSLNRCPPLWNCYTLRKLRSIAICWPQHPAECAEGSLPT